MRKPHLIVLVKQVTDTTAAASLRTEGEPDRNLLPAIINPEDRKALEAAFQVRDQIGGHITAVSMGPDRAEEVLREAMARGADEAVLLSDRRYAGADTLATAYALAQAVRKLEGDVVFCGRQSIDGDTAHVGPQVSVELGWPQVTFVSEVVASTASHLTVRRTTDEGIEELRAPLQAVYTVGGDGLECRPEQAKRLLSLRHHEIRHWNAELLEADPMRLGASGSRTEVAGSERISAPERENRRVGCDEESIRGLFEELIENHLIY